jgi:hypothetical protein
MAPSRRFAAPSVPSEPTSRPASPLTKISEDPTRDPVDLENPDLPADPRTSTPFEDQSSPNLAKAITLMMEELRRRDSDTLSHSKQASTKEPDTFDGSEARKLNNFILLCNLYFHNNPSYSDDENKVTFALSYLRGMALKLLFWIPMKYPGVPEWMDNWSALVHLLCTQFGPIDPTADAEDGRIDNLKQGCSGIKKKDRGRFFAKANSAGLTNLPNQEHFHI